MQNGSPTITPHSLRTPRDGRRALVLDFDGVIIDTEPLNFEAWNSAFEEIAGLRLPETERRSFVGGSIPATYDLWLRYHAARRPEAPPPTLSQAQKDAIFHRKTEIFFAEAARRLGPLPGVVTLIQQARALGWYVAIGSRSLRNRVHLILEIVRLPVTFDSIFGMEDLVDAETDRKVHARAVAPFGIGPEACVVIEDSPSGVREARAGGIARVIGLTSTLDAAALYAAGAHEVVEDLTTVQLAPVPAGR